MRTSKNRKIFSANNEQGTRIFTLGLHYSCIPSYNNIVKIFSNRPAVAGLIKKSSCSDLGRQASPLQHELGSGSPAFRGSYRVNFFQSFSGNHFSPRFMVPCSLLADNIFSVFRSPHLPLDTLIKKSSYSWTNQKLQL